MFMFQYHHDRLHLLADELRRDEPRQRLLRDIGERHHDLRAPVAAPRATSYTGPERRLVPCPEMKEAMTP